MSSEEPRLWKVTIALTATAEQVEQLTDRFTEVICADPQHDGPCAIPWALHVTEGDSLAKAERRRLREAIDGTNGQSAEIST